MERQSRCVQRYQTSADPWNCWLTQTWASLFQVPAFLGFASAVEGRDTGAGRDSAKLWVCTNSHIPALRAAHPHTSLARTLEHVQWYVQCSQGRRYAVGPPQSSCASTTKHTRFPRSNCQGINDQRTPASGRSGMCPLGLKVLGPKGNSVLKVPKSEPKPQLDTDTDATMSTVGHTKSQGHCGNYDLDFPGDDGRKGPAKAFWLSRSFSSA